MSKSIVLGGRHFWLFVLAGGPAYILYTYLIYHLYTLCTYTTIYIFGGPLAMSKIRPPTTMSKSAAHEHKILGCTSSKNTINGYKYQAHRQKERYSHARKALVENILFS